MIRTCLFDMGNVLVHFSHERMCEQLGALCGQTGAEVRRLVMDPGLWWDFERGRFGEDDFHRRFQQTVAADVDVADLRRAGSDIFQANAEIVPILDALKEHGCRLVLISNTSLYHFEWVRDRFEVLERFDDYVLSYEVGALKPDPAMFEAALEAIDCRPDECFYTDDIAENIEQGRRFGLQAELFTGADALARQLRERGLPIRTTKTNHGDTESRR